MNKERILQLADHIEQLSAYKFNMCDYVREDEQCGTIACIAGWAGKLWPEHEVSIINANGRSVIDWDNTAQLALDLGDHTASDLFIPMIAGSDAPSPYFGDQRKRAAKVLRHLAETGKIDWTLT